MNRLVSLDVFRGATVAFMILVNNPGSGEFVYSPLRHAKWHGWTPTDLVFPFFLWIVGVAMTLSFATRLERGADRMTLWKHAMRRGAMIFLIGFLLNLIPSFDFEHVRVLGVLQRIGLCYMIGSTIYLFTPVRGQIAAIVILLVGYWALMIYYPVPGYGPGLIDEKEGNFAQWIDSKLLAGHMWASARTWDPEGIPSTFPAVCNVLLGAMAGYLLRKKQMIQLIPLGIGLAVAGQLWSLTFAINKQLWTSSFVLWTCGLASIVFYLVWWVVDEMGWRAWAKPFEFLGMNALAAYVGSGLLAKTLSITGAHRWLWDHFYSAIASPINASFLFAFSEVLFFVVLCWWLWQRKIFIRL